MFDRGDFSEGEAVPWLCSTPTPSQGVDEAAEL